MSLLIVSHFDIRYEIGCHVWEYLFFYDTCFINGVQFIFYFLLKHIYSHLSCRAVVDAMAKRHTDNSFQVDDFNIELENQSGDKMKVGTETDQRCDFTFDFLVL